MVAVPLTAPGDGDLIACATFLQPNHGWDQAHLTAKEAAAFWKSHMQPVADRQERAAVRCSRAGARMTVLCSWAAQHIVAAVAHTRNYSFPVAPQVRPAPGLSRSGTLRQQRVH